MLDETIVAQRWSAEERSSVVRRKHLLKKHYTERRVVRKRYMRTRRAVVADFAVHRVGEYRPSPSPLHVLQPIMNSLNSLGQRQIASLNADLAKMESGEAGPSIQGPFSRDSPERS